MATSPMLSQFATITSRLSAMEESQQMDMVSRILSMIDETPPASAPAPASASASASASGSDDSRSLRSKINFIIEDYDFKDSMKRFFYNLITEEPQVALDALYEESGLKGSHPAIDYKTKAYNIVMDFGFDGTPMEAFFKNIPCIGVDKAIDELFTECL